MKFEEALEIAQGPPSAEARFIEACTVVLTAPEAKAEFRVEALISRGIAYGMERRSTLALSDLDEAVRRDPHYDRAYVNRALIHSMINNDQMALSDFNRSIDLNRANAIAYFGRAQLFRRQGMIAEAIADAGLARALDQGNPHFERLWEQLLDESWAGAERLN